MSETQVYVTRHRLIHDGVKYAKASKVTLTKKDALPLLAKGAIVTPDAANVIVVQAPAVLLPQTTLAKLTIPELLEYAKASNIAIEGGANKEQILAAFAAVAPPPVSAVEV